MRLPGGYPASSFSFYIGLLTFSVHSVAFVSYLSIAGSGLTQSLTAAIWIFYVQKNEGVLQQLDELSVVGFTRLINFFVPIGFPASLLTGHAAPT